jgi:acyl-CoA oxidase
MPATFEALWQEPSLRSLAPLVLAAWEDRYLTPEELLSMRAALERAPGLDAAAHEVVRAWLDPAAPPPPCALAALERELADWLVGQPAARGGSLSELAARLAESSPGAADGNATRAALAPLDDMVAYADLPTAGQRTPAATSMQPPERERAASIARLRGALDGPYREVRDEVRSILADPQFRFVSELSTQAYREQVLSWCRALAATGLVERRSYPNGLAAGRDIGQFVSAFETLAFFDLSLVVKFGVQFGLFGGSVEGLGTEKHHALLPAIARAELLGCFAMTERARGSNVRDLRTVARYDPERHEFVITTPDLGAGKEWIGNAALHARLALVFAQLETLGERYGVHAFLVPIRDQHGAPLRGVRIEDCGEKMGLNGVDNGRLWFDNVRVPRDALLDRFGQVAEDGSYTSPIPSSGKRFFTMLGTLVGGRVSVAGAALSAAKVGLAIAIGYGARRTQFPDAQGHDKTLLAYLTHRRRLLPRLGAAFAFSFAQHELVRRFAALGREESTREVERLAAGLKALGTWQAVDTLQQCRECCGGQGYLTSNRIDALRTDSDVFTTFEGDNTVLLQLVAKELLGAFRHELKRRPVRTLVRAVAANVASAVIEQNPLDARRQDGDSLRAPEFQVAALRFREKSLLESLTKRLLARTARGMPAQAAFEECQDHALSLARAHIEHFVLATFQEAARGDGQLEQLCALYGLWRLEADAAWFLENGYFAGAKARGIRKELNRACDELASDAPALVEAFAIPATCLGPLADPDYLAATGLTQAQQLPASSR